MKIKIDFTKTAQENADDYYKRSKRLLQKAEGAERAIAELKKRLEKAKNAAPEKTKTNKVVKIREREWYEKFHWFFTSNGMLVIAGRDAHQNEAINSKHFDNNDLFFHANIFGAPATVLKDGIASDPEIRGEVAQFAASYSSAWKENLNTVDVYAMRRNQVSKSTSKGSLGTGSFLLSGEREWYRNTTLTLVMYIKDGNPRAVPEITFQKTRVEGTDPYVYVSIGREKKSDAAKKIAKRLGTDDLDSIMQQLPTGEFKLK